ncbi:peptide chain release factor 1 [Ceratobasidium sp. AG-Ba]|nr:peptide chain release factor 1 [Ceratobasidium sp. AG-Ba]QRW07470.1 peptide chain release factor 1 [Ceratobasidium sp. AG-Ba]
MSMSEQIRRSKLLKEVETLDKTWKEWLAAREAFLQSEQLLEDPDPELRALATDEQASLLNTLQKLASERFPSLLIQNSPTASYGAIMELKAGVGGSESALFLGDLSRMYARFAATHRFGCEWVEKNEAGVGGGIKDAILEIKGEGAYDLLRWESGVHRVQRVPATEAQGRVHTSTVAVVVLPAIEGEANENEADDILDPKDVRTDVMRSRGAGGQHVNRTESAVRLTHEPTGITVSMQDSRSQHQNRAKAWLILRARLLDRKIQADIAARRAVRRDLVKGADRSEKVRTYNFAQDRVTDHRVGISIKNLVSVLEGDALEDIIQALQRDHEASVMEELLQNDID